MEMARIEERMSLKHKNTSKWVRDNLKRGKHIDPVSRQDIFKELVLIPFTILSCFYDTL